MSPQGTEEQKQELLPGMATCALAGCWALTEPSNGSDASALTTTATKASGGGALSASLCGFLLHRASRHQCAHRHHRHQGERLAVFARAQPSPGAGPQGACAWDCGCALTATAAAANGTSPHALFSLCYCRLKPVSSLDAEGPPVHCAGAGRVGN